MRNPFDTHYNPAVESDWDSPVPTNVGGALDQLAARTRTVFRRKMVAIPFGANELTGSEVTTSFSFPANGAILHNAFIHVDDAESGTMDVGTQGISDDPDGILDGISLASTGYVFPTVTRTTGLNATYISASTFGALSHITVLGSDVAGDEGVVIPRNTFIAGGDPVSITSSGDLNSCSGTLYLDYTEL